MQTFIEFRTIYLIEKQIKFLLLKISYTKLAWYYKEANILDGETSGKPLLKTEWTELGKGISAIKKNKW